MKNLWLMIKQFRQYRKDIKNIEASGILVDKEEMYRWFKLPQGKVFFDILLTWLNNETRQVFVGHTAVRNFEEFMYRKGKMAILENMLMYIKQIVIEREGK